MAALETSPVSPGSVSSLDDDGVVASSSGSDMTLDRVLGLLLRDRAEGGYGGRVSFSEFTQLSHAAGWDTEEQEDAWYTLVEGVPLSSTRRVHVLADLLCRHHTSNCARSLSLLPLPSPSPAVTAPVAAPTVEVEATASCEGKEDGLPAATPDEMVHRRGPEESGILNREPVLPRYALPTTASAHRVAHSFLLQSVLRSDRPSSTRRRRQRHADPVQPNSVDRAAPDASGPQTVFDRLYPSSPAPRAADSTPVRTAHSPCDGPGKGAERTRGSTPRRHATPSTGPGGDMTGSVHVKAVSPLKRASSRARSQTYNKPTQSYYAKLIGTESAARFDPIADAPPTPRVAYHRAPGPSCSVPPGYVEGVARRRKQTAARFYGDCFEDTLRRPSFRADDTDRTRDAAWLNASPILRLPLSSEAGERGTVDVRLATTNAPHAHGDPASASAQTCSAAGGYCAIHLGLREKRRGASASHTTGSPPLCHSQTASSTATNVVPSGFAAQQDREHFKAHRAMCN